MKKIIKLDYHIFTEYNLTIYYIYLFKFSQRYKILLISFGDIVDFVAN